MSNNVSETELKVCSDVATMVDNHEYIDLGLPSGTLWATCNIGASAPEEYGDYYAWGEISTKDDYFYNSIWMNNNMDNDEGSYNLYTKYYSGVDTLTNLETSDDVVSIIWGANWKIPTKDEMNELLKCCTHVCTTQNGINGRLFTGPNGKSIFFPAAGYRVHNDLIYADTLGCYWSSSLYTDMIWGLSFFLYDGYQIEYEGMGVAYALCFAYDVYSMEYYEFSNGLPIRPVCRFRRE